MTRDEHKTIVNSLLGMIAPEHQAAASESLTQLSDDYDQTLTGWENDQNTVTTLTENNEKLRKVNADLFLRVGTQPAKKDPTPAEDEDEIPNIPFSDLFDEKGELK